MTIVTASYRKSIRYPQNGPISETERRVLGMWRHMSVPIKERIFSRMVTARLTPDLVLIPDLTEEKLNALIIETVSEDGEYQDHPTPQRSLHEDVERYNAEKKREGS